MRPSFRIAVAPGVAVALLLAAPAARAEEVPAEYRATIAKGLDWMVKQQQKDGHWAAFNEQYPVTMTALGGMSLLCEGSTIREGKYKDNIRRATEWLMER